jgi:hypothetical protein
MTSRQTRTHEILTLLNRLKEDTQRELQLYKADVLENPLEVRELVASSI